MRKAGRNILCMVMVMFLLSGCLTGCGGAGESFNNASKYMNEEKAAYEDNGIENSVSQSVNERADENGESEELPEEGVAGTGASDSLTADHKRDKAKIIKRYHFDYETETFDKSYIYLKEQIEQFGGYVSSSEMMGMGLRTLHLTARIPAEASDEFTSRLGGLGTVTSQSESAEDVTLQYMDTESRIASLKIEQERLNALLEKADSLENIFKLEERLTQVRYELENYQSQKNHYDDLISYSTVNITLEEVEYTVEIDDKSIFSKISTGFRSSFRNVINDIEGFFICLLVMVPYLVEWAVILLIVGGIIRCSVRYRRKRKAAKDTESGIEQKDRKKRVNLFVQRKSMGYDDKNSEKQKE